MVSGWQGEQLCSGSRKPAKYREEVGSHNAYDMATAVCSVCGNRVEVEKTAARGDIAAIAVAHFNPGGDVPPRPDK